MSSRPVKKTVYEVVANDVKIRQLVEDARAVEQRRWDTEQRAQLRDGGFAPEVAFVAVKRSQYSHTARARAMQIEKILEDLHDARS